MRVPATDSKTANGPTNMCGTSRLLNSSSLQLNQKLAAPIFVGGNEAVVTTRTTVAGLGWTITS